jgi:hypothetical protein
MGELRNLFPGLPQAHSTYDAFVTIFFTGGAGTTMGFGWFERHVAVDKLVKMIESIYEWTPGSTET